MCQPADRRLGRTRDCARWASTSQRTGPDRRYGPDRWPPVRRRCRSNGAMSRTGAGSSPSATDRPSRSPELLLAVRPVNARQLPIRLHRPHERTQSASRPARSSGCRRCSPARTRAGTSDPSRRHSSSTTAGSPGPIQSSRSASAPDRRRRPPGYRAWRHLHEVQPPPDDGHQVGGRH